MDEAVVNVVVFQDGPVWVAHCVDFDIVAQGPDVRTVSRRLELTLKVEIAESLRRYGEVLKGIGPAPSFIAAKWSGDSSAFRAKGLVSVPQGDSKEIGYEMKLCA